MGICRVEDWTDSHTVWASLPGGQGTLRVIAGEYAGAKGPAQTFTPILVGDLRFASNQRTDLPCLMVTQPRWCCSQALCA